MHQVPKCLFKEKVTLREPLTLAHGSTQEKHRNSDNSNSERGPLAWCIAQVNCLRLQWKSNNYDKALPYIIYELNCIPPSPSGDRARLPATGMVRDRL